MTRYAVFFTRPRPFGFMHGMEQLYKQVLIASSGDRQQIIAEARARLSHAWFRSRCLGVEERPYDP